jgi:hypothetical protein
LFFLIMFNQTITNIMYYITRLLILRIWIFKALITTVKLVFKHFQKTYVIQSMDRYISSIYIFTNNRHYSFLNNRGSEIYFCFNLQFFTWSWTLFLLLTHFYFLLGKLYFHIFCSLCSGKYFSHFHAWKIITTDSNKLHFEKVFIIISILITQLVFTWLEAHINEWRVIISLESHQNQFTCLYFLWGEPMIILGISGHWLPCHNWHLLSITNQSMRPEW